MTPHLFIGLGLLVFTAVVAILVLIAELVWRRPRHPHRAAKGAQDAVTGLLVREKVLKRANTALRRGLSRKIPATLLIAGLDHFKQVHQTHGQAVADAILQESATRLARAIRQDDVLGRFGDGEFILLLPRADRRESIAVAERLRALIASSPMRHGELAIAQTVSIGLASAPEHGTSLETLIGKAEAALRLAKHAGQDRVLGAD